MQIPGQQCALVALVVFIIVGFQRGWRRELVSLVFVMLATLLIHKDTSDALGAFLGRLPAIFAYMTGTQAPADNGQAANGGFLGGPFWSLIIFAGLVALGYYVGNKVFPRPTTPQERFIGIVPAIIAGAFFISYMTEYLRSINVVSGGNNVSVNLQSPDPANYVPIVVVIGIIALVAALIAARVKRASGKK
jgi:hypothetical protein